MLHNKLLTRSSCWCEMLVRGQVSLELGAERFISSSGHADFIEDGENREFFWLCWVTCNQVNARLVVLVSDALPWNLFFLVLRLFHREHVVVELPLQLFICKVDAKLFKRVELENFETEDIQNTSESLFLGFLWVVAIQKRDVQFLANEIEHPLENELGERVSTKCSRVWCVGHVHWFSHRLGVLLGEETFHIGSVFDTKVVSKLGGEFCCLFVEFAFSSFGFVESNITQTKNSD